MGSAPSRLTGKVKCGSPFSFSRRPSDAGWRETLGTLDAKQLYALTDSLEATSDGLGSRNRLAAFLLYHPGIKVGPDAAKLLRACLGKDEIPRFDAIYGR